MIRYATLSIVTLLASIVALTGCDTPTSAENTIPAEIPVFDADEMPPLFFGEIEDDRHGLAGLPDPSDFGDDDFDHTNALVGAFDSSRAVVEAGLIAGPPMVVLRYLFEGTVTPISWHTTEYTRSYEADGVTIDGVLTVTFAWTRWDLSVDLTSSDGALVDARLLQGESGLLAETGFWDVLDPETGDVYATMDWTYAGSGFSATAERLAAPARSVTLQSASGVTDVILEDLERAETRTVTWNPDHSGVVVDPDHNFGFPACWDADLVDCPC